MQRKREALFSLQVERLRQYALRQHLQQDFSITVGSAQFIGYCSKCKFDDPVIEKWGTYLERGQHTRSVNFYENVFRHVGVEVGGRHFLQNRSADGARSKSIRFG